MSAKYVTIRKDIALFKIGKPKRRIKKLGIIKLKNKNGYISVERGDGTFERMRIEDANIRKSYAEKWL